MPFDPTPITKTKWDGQSIASPEAFWAAEPDTRLRMLAYALRHMPMTHQWFFGNITSLDGFKRPACGTAGCAIGLAYALFDKKRISANARDDRVYNAMEWAVKTFSITWDEASSIFGADYANTYRQSPNPAMIAQVIDSYLRLGRSL